MTTENNVPFSQFLQWGDIQNGNPIVFELMKAFWIAYLISRDEQFLKILQKITHESPAVIHDVHIHQIAGEPQKVFDTFIELEKNPNGMALWLHVFDCIECLSVFGFLVLQKAKVIPEIEQSEIFANTSISQKRILVRHKIISISPYARARWFRIYFDKNEMIVSMLSESLPNILLPSIRKSNAITYLIIKENNGLMWYPIEK